MVLKRVERWKGQWRGQHTVLESLTTRGGSAAVVVSLVTRELGVENDVHICAACPDVCRIAVTNVAAMGKREGIYVKRSFLPNGTVTFPLHFGVS